MHDDFSKQADISLLRIFSTLAVIFLHTNNTLTSNTETFHLTNVQNIFFSCGYAAMNWAVPVFLMITGALMLKKEKQIDYPTCIKKYVKRVFMALLIFGIPFSMMEIFMNDRNLNPSMLGRAIINVVNGQSWGHLWYLYALIGIYLIFPILKTVSDNLDRKQILTFLIVLFVFNFCFPIINDLTGLSIGFTLPISSFTVFYVLTGYYITEYDVKIKRKTAAILSVLAVGVAILTVVVIYPKVSTYAGYSSPIIAILAILLFMAFRRIEVKERTTERLWKIDRLCFGVYLIHPVFINFIYKFLKISPVAFEYYWLTVPIFFAFFAVCSFVASWVMSKIKPLKKYVL